MFTSCSCCSCEFSLCAFVYVLFGSSAVRRFLWSSFIPFRMCVLYACSQVIQRPGKLSSIASGVFDLGFLQVKRLKKGDDDVS